MNALSKWFVSGAIIAAIGTAVGAVPAWADTEAVGVSADVPVRTTLDLVRDANSVVRGTLSTLVFDKFDDIDTPGGSPIRMYAPYRTAEAGKNWHLASIISNASAMTLTADVTGTVAGTPLASLLETFFGGFFNTAGVSQGGASTDWESLDTFSRLFSAAFTGTAPFNYRLKLDGIPGSASAYTGSVTFTLVAS